MKSSPSVLQLRSSSGLYGADRLVLLLNEALARSQVSSRLLCIENYLLRDQSLDRIAKLQGHDAALLPCNGRLDPRTVWALSSQIETRRRVVVHAHDYKSAFYAWLATRGKSTPLIATLHGNVESSRALRIYHRVELALLRRFDAVVVVASSQVEMLVRAGILRSRIYQIDNAIDLPPTQTGDIPLSRESLRLEASDFVFAAVARLAPEKNLAMLLDVFKEVAGADSNAVLLLIGDGPDRDELQAHAGRLGLGDRARFLGARNDMDRIYPLIDCLVLPSLSEGMPLVVLEAMAFALPIVASAVGDVPRLLSKAEFGQLVPANDRRALGIAMQAALAQPGRRDHKARSYVYEHHSPRVMAGHYLEIYRSLWAEAYERKAS